MKKTILLAVISVVFNANAQGYPSKTNALPYGSLSEAGLDSALVYRQVDSIITNGIKKECLSRGPGSSSQAGQNSFS